MSLKQKMDRVKLIFIIVVSVITLGIVISTLYLNYRPKFFPDGILIDVRSVPEFESGHIDGAVNIPLNEIANKIAEVVPDKTSPINLVCLSGIRAGQAANILTEMGYKKVANVGTQKNARKLLKL